MFLLLKKFLMKIIIILVYLIAQVLLCERYEEQQVRPLDGRQPELYFPNKRPWADKITPMGGKIFIFLIAPKNDFEGAVFNKNLFICSNNKEKPQKMDRRSLNALNRILI